MTIAGRRRGRGDLRARARRLAAGRASTSPRRSPGRTTSRSSPVNHLEGHVYAGWLLDPGEAEHDAPPFPLVALVVSRRPHVPRRDARPPRRTGCSARPSTTRRARRSTRSAGCSASATRADRRSRGRPRRRRRTTACSRGPGCGDTYDLSFSGLKTAARRIVGAGARRRGPAGRRARRPPARAASWPSSPGGSRTRSSTCSRRRRSGRPRRSARGRSCSAAAWRRTRRSGARIAGEAEARGMPLVVPRPGPVHRQRGDDRRGRRPAARRGRARRARPRRPAVAAARPMTGAGEPPPTSGSIRGTSAATLRGRPASGRATASARTSSPTSTCSRGSCARPTRARAAGCWRSARGSGFLTGGLLAAGAAVTAVELDRGMAAFLRDDVRGRGRGRRACG